MTVFAREYCHLHQRIRPAGEQCPVCAIVRQEGRQARDITSIIIGQVDDHGAELLALRRQVNELRHLVIELQRLHNEKGAE